MLYINLTTGERTESREVFHSWLRADNEVEVYKNGKYMMTFRSIFA